MNWLRERPRGRALILTVCCAPVIAGCHGVVAAFLLKVLVSIGAELAGSYIGQAVEKKLDEWFFDKDSSDNSGGDVSADSTGLAGKYNGKMEIVITKGDEQCTVTVSNPRMIRDSEGSPWRLDPGIIQTAKQRSEESLGG